MNINQQLKKQSVPIRVYFKTTNINRLSKICDRSGMSISSIVNAAVQVGLKDTKAIIKDAKDAKKIKEVITKDGALHG